MPLPELKNYDPNYNYNEKPDGPWTIHYYDDPPEAWIIELDCGESSGWWATNGHKWFGPLGFENRSAMTREEAEKWVEGGIRCRIAKYMARDMREIVYLLDRHFSPEEIIRCIDNDLPFPIEPEVTHIVG